MAIWTKRSGTKLAVLQERITTSINLPVDSQAEVSLISGNLPTGMRVVGTNIEGTPFEVPRTTTFRFVLRATLNDQKEDRTFSIDIEGSDAPQWITQEDLLPIGNNDAFYILDSAPVDFQLRVRDTDTSSGQKLRYFIGNDAGQLPPGITLTEDGRLVGVVDPVLALDKIAGNGFYDENNYDKYPYDFSIKSSQGFDSFFFDVTRYDFAEPTLVPRKLNRYYEFTVSVSDGDTISDRTFRIFVVGDDFFRADNTIMQVGTGVFTADNTFVRTPIWLTPSDLGVRRANNFITLFLDVIDPNSLVGVVNYSLEQTNDDGSPSELPPGTSLDTLSGEIAGRVPYQPAVTRDYKFTVKATRFSSGTTETAESVKTFSVKLIGEVDSTIQWLTAADLGTIPSNYISTLSVKAQTNVPNATLLYRLESGTLPPGLDIGFDGEIIGKINSFGTVNEPGLTLFDNGTTVFDGDTTKLDREFKFTISARDQFGFSAISREFTIRVEDPDNKLYSNLFYKPLLKRDQRAVFQEWLSDSSIFDPSIIYRPNDPRFGIQKEIRLLVYAGIETVLANRYVAAIAKNTTRKNLKILDIKTAVAKEPGTNNILYEVVYLEVTDPYEKDGDVKNQITIRNDNKILVNSVKTTPDEPYYDVAIRNTIPIATRKNSANKKYFDDFIECVTRSGVVQWYYGSEIYLETRNSTGPTRNVAYVRGSTTNLVNRPVPENTITADSNAIKVSDPNSRVRYISNISNVRNAIRDLGVTERNFLPLWMRTAQENSIQELGYTLAIPLAYCKPGTAKTVESAIRFSNFNFRQFELDVDRFVIDSTEGNSQEQYIVFHNYEFNI